MPEHEGQGEILMDEKVAELKITKSPEEIKAEEEKERKAREERFYKDPDSFMEMKDLILAAMDTPQGVMTFVGKGYKRYKIEIAQSRLNHIASQEFMRMEVMAFKKAQQGKRIVAPKPRGAFGNPFKRR